METIDRNVSSQTERAVITAAVACSEIGSAQACREHATTRKVYRYKISTGATLFIITHQPHTLRLFRSVKERLGQYTRCIPSPDYSENGKARC